MQKKIIALAIAGLASGVACAQSNVTVYGIADVAATNFTTSNSTTGNMKSQRGFDDGAVGSRIGFKGAEDLGNGLKAEFLFEFGVAPTNNIAQTNAASGALNNLSTRQSYVALTSAAAGQFAMGRFQAPGWDYQANARPWGGVDPIRTSTNVFGMNLNSSDRISNAFQWTSPTWSGFKFKGLYSSDFNSTQADYNNNDQTYVQNGVVKAGAQSVYYVSAYYDQGPIASQLVYRNAAKSKDAAADNGKYEWAFRGAYDFGTIKPGLLYQKQHLNMVNAFGIQDAYAYGGFVTFTVNPKFLLTLEAAKSKGDNSTGANGYMLNGQYLFSKRTSIYGQYGYVKMRSENGANGIATTNLGSYGNTPIEAGQHLNGFMAGILHTF